MAMDCALDKCAVKNKQSVTMIFLHIGKALRSYKNSLVMTLKKSPNSGTGQ
jgi:hypothetical protein